MVEALMKNKYPAVYLKLFALLLGAGCVSFAGARGSFKDGTYPGTGEGYRGPVRVALRLESGAIADIEIAEHGDDPLVGGAAMEELREAVIYANSAALDTVSGATESSAGFLSAVDDALSKAAEAAK
jgi:fumarate reductase flavoprotein subunit